MKIGSRLMLAEDKAKQAFQKITLRLLLPVGEAKGVPPLGPLLGQYQINIVSFCNEFNTKSSVFFENGVMVFVKVSLKKDKSYVMSIKCPSFFFLLMQVLTIKEDKYFLSIEKLYDLIVIQAFFLSKNVVEVSNLIFGYLSSFVYRKKIIIVF